MERQVQTESKSYRIVQPVVSKKEFIVPILEIVGKGLDRAAEMHCLYDV